MRSAEKKRTIESIRPIVSAVLPENHVLQIIRVKRGDNLDDVMPGLHVRLVTNDSTIPVAFISSFADEALRRENPTNVLDLPALVKIKAYNSILEVRDIEEGDDKNLKPGAYYRWVRPYGSVVVPVVIESDGNVKILMQQVYRHQIAKFGWELPMGGVNDGETPLDAAKREFREETGLSAKQVTDAFAGYTDPGTSTAGETFYIAQGFREVGGKIEENETIGKLRAFTLKECLEMIDKKEIDRIETIAGILQVYRLANEHKLEAYKSEDEDLTR